MSALADLEPVTDHDEPADQGDGSSCAECEQSQSARLAVALEALTDEVQLQRRAVGHLADRLEAVEQHAAGVEQVVAQLGPAFESIQASPLGRMFGALAAGTGNGEG